MLANQYQRLIFTDGGFLKKILPLQLRPKRPSNIPRCYSATPTSLGLGVNLAIFRKNWPFFRVAKFSRNLGVRFARISAFLSVDPHQRQGPEIEKARAGGIETAFKAPISILGFQYLAPSGAEDQ